MKKLIQLFVLSTIALVSVSQAKAALLIEPVLGYNFGTFNSEVKQTNDKDSNSLHGYSYGGRLGYQQLGLQLGLDYLGSKMRTDGDDFNTSEWAGFVGYEFPILFRVYAGYIFSGTGNYKADTTTKFKGGTGPKVGIGCTVLPFLDVNLEYRRLDYDSKNVGGFTTDVDYSSVMLGVSLPFTI